MPPVPRAAATLAAALSLAGAEPRLVFYDEPADDRFGTVAVLDLAADVVARLAAAPLEPRDWQRLLAVYTAGDEPDGERPDERPPVLGHYWLESNALRFRPRFTFSAGLTYRAFLSAEALDRLTPDASPHPRRTLTFTMPEPKRAPTTRVTAVYPSSAELPANLLRLYVHFSAPMRAQDIHRHIHLYDQTGREAALPFVEVETGLWDRAQRRLTLFFHPGRIKRGVGPHEAMGPPLEPDREYRLVIDRAMPDARGFPLIERYEKRFRTTAADRSSPDRDGLAVTPPASAASILYLELPEPLDHALLHRFVQIFDATGEPVPGSIAVDDGERRWLFEPEEPWRPGTYSVRVLSALEDRSGNTFDAPFDVAPQDRPRLGTATTLELTFRYE